MRHDRHYAHAHDIHGRNPVRRRRGRLYPCVAVVLQNDIRLAAVLAEEIACARRTVTEVYHHANRVLRVDLWRRAVKPHPAAVPRAPPRQTSGAPHGGDGGRGSILQRREGFLRVQTVDKKTQIRARYAVGRRRCEGNAVHKVAFTVGNDRQQRPLSGRRRLFAARREHAGSDGRAIESHIVGVCGGGHEGCARRYVELHIACIGGDWQLTRRDSGIRRVSKRELCTRSAGNADCDVREVVARRHNDISRRARQRESNHRRNCLAKD